MVADVFTAEIVVLLLQQQATEQGGIAENPVALLAEQIGYSEAFKRREDLFRLGSRRRACLAQGYREAIACQVPQP